jgi:hypothetical protein
MQTNEHRLDHRKLFSTPYIDRREDSPKQYTQQRRIPILDNEVRIVQLNERHEKLSREHCI